MGRRSDHTREELYALALGAARRIAASEGAAGLTARRIAGEIGYSQGTLYNLFNDLDDILLRLNGETLDDIQDTLARVRTDGTPEVALKALADAYVAFTRKHARRWAMLFEDVARARQQPEWYRAKIDRLFGLVERVLAPLFKPADAAACRTSARVLWSSLHGICSLAATSAVITPADVQRMTGTLVKYYLAGLRAERR